MKKVLLFVLGYALPLIASAQSFTLTPDGFRNAEDESKDYIVVQIDGTQEELFNKAKTAVTSIFSSPKDVLSFNEPDIIVATGISSGDLQYKMMGMVTFFDVPYRLQMQFKEGRIRIDAPAASKGIVNGGRGEMFFGRGGGLAYIFKKDGKLRLEKQKKQLEDYFNGLVANIISKIEKGAAQEDW